MSDEPTVKRHEIMEERANHDARHLAFALILLLGMMIAVLGIGAWKLNVILMPLMQREPVAAPKKAVQGAILSTLPRQPDTPHRTSSRPWSAPSVVHFTCGLVPSFPARVTMLAKAIRPRHSAQAAGPQQFIFRREAVGQRKPPCPRRSGVSGAVVFGNTPTHEVAAQRHAPGSTMAVSVDLPT